MKRILTIATYLLAGFAVALSVSCGDDHEWGGSGPKPAADNPGVYFAGGEEKILEMDSKESGAVLKMGRDASKTSSALTVPIAIRYAAANVTVPAEAHFAAGEEFTQINLTVSDFEFSTPYPFCIEVSERYGIPYSKKGSTRFEGQIEVVSVVGIATFTPGRYSGSNQPKLVPFQHKIYDNRDGTYTIKNFLFNNAGYSFTFRIGDDKDILPVEDCGWHDLEENRWYFYSAAGDASANRIPCYLPGEDPEDFVEYIYFYAWESTSSHKAFWLDLETRSGAMMGYARYNVSSSGRIQFDISW